MKRFAIFVGIDSYSNGITPLRCACNDAKELSMKFAAAGFETLRLLLNEEASCVPVIKNIDRMMKHVDDGDLLVFYFAGHGRELNNEHYLVCKDGEADPSSYEIDSLPVSNLVKRTNKPGVRRLFILDCCRDNLLAGRSTAYACEESRSIALDNAVKMQSGFIPPLILNSCSSGEKAFEDPASGHGYFTQALLKTIGDAAVNNFYIFRRQLKQNMSSSGTQNICWNGSVDDWDDVKLFASWNPASSPAHALQPYPANYYDACLEAEESEKTLEKYKLPLSSAMSSAKRKAEIARNNGDWNKEIEFRQDFIKLITAAVDAEKQRIADVKAEAEGALKCASQVLKFSIFSKKTVTGVKDKNITSIVIPNGVTKIGRLAFFGCKSLTSVTIPSSVTTIGDFAFGGCKSLTSVTIPDSVTEIGGDAFSGCTSLTSVTIPSSVKKIDSEAFSGCTSLTSVTIPSGVTGIGSGAFWGCKSLTSVTIPSSVTTIGYHAFSGCRSLRSVTIPSSVEKIGSGAFNGVKAVKVSAANKRFAVYACGELIDLKNKELLYFPPEFNGEYAIPASVMTIGYYAFSDCTSLTSVTIPDGVTTIGDRAFAYCTSLTSVTIPDSVTEIGGDAFSDCTSLRSVTIPSSVTGIGRDAFSGCTSLTSVTIPRFCKIYGTSFPETCSVIRRNQPVLSWLGQLCWRSIKKNAKQDAIFLAIAIVLVIIGIISSCDSALSAAKDQGMVFDDDDIAVIGVESSKRDGLEKAVIPKDIRIIGKSAFAGCHNLTSVVIPDSVEVIGSGAFRNSPNLKKVQIPSSVTAIGKYAFQNCHSLESVTIPAGVKVIDEGVFQNCRNLTEMRTPAGVGGILYHAFAGCSNLKNVQISFGPSVIAYEAFQNCRNLESVFIPDSVQSIGFQAFAGCSKLKHVTIPRNCQLGHAAFPDGCTVTRR